MKKTIIPFAVLLLTLTSCRQWLDVRPETEVDRHLLFSSQEGFQEALLGVYTRCTDNALYGRELTVGTPEVLIQNYNISANDPLRYMQTRNFQYDNGDFIRRKDGIWRGLYHAIANCNLILEHIDEQERIFAPGYYALIKGETLALRAYLHFDALRLFAPAFAVSPNANAIPYVTSYSNMPTAMSSVSAVLDSAIRDLQAAKALLVDEPIRASSYIAAYPLNANGTPGPELTNHDLFLQNRRHRMNYYAVCGTLARAYLYKQDKLNAYENAMEVMLSNKFPFTASSDFLAVDEDKRDRILYTELVFAWYIPRKNHDLNTNWFRTGTAGMHLLQEAAQTIYETSGAGSTDLRYRQWLSTVGVNNVYISEIHKYRRNPLSNENNANRHYLMAPALRLSELYYIAAECTYESNPELATQYIDAVRRNRGIDQPLSVANAVEFEEELVKEYRKELFAEGQLFYTHKRLNRPFRNLQGVVIAPSNLIFVLPLPDDEIIYGER
ncbi:RagB/SusD family nutrient uptake outer membrane protein [Parapedobacter deserti]|uniref:RagB/SusD family nutrient uptake outer membrane protein n=1 Tax=Parapedobacter deserti TaxID=1912957 RepID=A0ABV7JP90_9SPHI